MTEDWVQRLSSALGLSPEAQDWGIQNSDPERLVEFIEFYRSYVVRHPWEPEAVAELILESANDALEAGGLDAGTHELLREFIHSYSEEFPNTMSYWRSLATAPNLDEFPLARILKSLEVPVRPPLMKQPDGLLSVLRDPYAREDERDAAAIDLDRFDEPDVEASLLTVASNSKELDSVACSAGESLGVIWARKGRVPTGAIEHLRPDARREALDLLKHIAPSLLDDDHDE